MTEESANANSRMCVTLRLDPCPLELGQQDRETREFNKIEFLFAEQLHYDIQRYFN